MTVDLSKLKVGDIVKQRRRGSKFVVKIEPPIYADGYYSIDFGDSTADIFNPDGACLTFSASDIVEIISGDDSRFEHFVTIHTTINGNYMGSETYNSKAKEPQVDAAKPTIDARLLAKRLIEHAKGDEK